MLGTKFRDSYTPGKSSSTEPHPQLKRVFSISKYALIRLLGARTEQLGNFSNQDTRNLIQEGERR